MAGRLAQEARVAQSVVAELGQSEILATKSGAYAFDDLANAIQQRYPGRMVGTGEGIPVTIEQGMQISRGGKFSIPEEMIRPYSSNIDDQLARKYLWSVDKDGIRLMREKSGVPGLGRGGDVTHTNLTGGGVARAGGEVWFTGTNSVRLNAASRAYGMGHSIAPLTRGEYASVIRMWRNLGYKVEAVPLGAR